MVTLLRALARSRSRRPVFAPALAAAVVVQALFALSPLTAQATVTTATWTGCASGGTNHNWSNSFNWSTNTAPVTGNIVAFPSSASSLVCSKTSVNDIAGLDLSSVTFADSTGYTVSGNALTIDSGGVTSSAGSNAVSTPVALNAA